MKRILTLILSFFIPIAAWAQGGELQGKITDKKTGAVIELANVAVYENGTLKTGSPADFDGFYTIKPINPGTYDIQVTYVGYKTTEVKGVVISANKITFLDVQLEQSGGVQLQEVVIKEYKVPLLEQDKTSTGGTITKEEIANLPTKQIYSIASTTAGVYQKGEGSKLNIRGGRDDATDYYVDGIKVAGTVNIPASAIEQLSVITGGVPASYGDVTGGIVNITTRGPSSKYYGGIELITSELLDAYGHRFASGTLSGPLVWKNRKNEALRRPLLGFFVALEYQHDKDPSPSAAPLYTAKDEVIEELRKNPLSIAPSGQGIVNNYQYVKKEDLVKIKARPNMAQDQYRGVLRMDVNVNKTIDLAFGGSYDVDFQRDFADSYTLFNSENNSQGINTNWRTYARFIQKFNTDTTKNSSFKNAYYRIQADVSQYNTIDQSKVLKADIFKYGHVGKFQTYRAPVYIWGTNQSSGVSGYQLVGYVDTLVTYTPGDANPYLSDLTSQYYQLAGNNVNDYYSTIIDIESNNGMINGTRTNSAQSAYSIWYIAGRRPFLYRNTNDNQFRLSANGSVDFKPKGVSERNKHSIEFGVEYEQRVERLHAINAAEIWTLMRQLANSASTELDESNPIYITRDGVYQDTIFYNQNFDTSKISMFDYKLRQKLGYDYNQWIDIDALDPSTFSLDMFSADELLKSESPYVAYYGYTHDGELLRKNPSFEDFFKKYTTVNVNGYNYKKFTREIGAYRPIYTAAYLQDKFAFKDLIFNIGLRVDRFDANQKVLRDAYSLYGVKTAAEVANLGAHPSTIGDDYVVYVNSATNPTQITGYRDGDNWYDAEGNFVSDVNSLASQFGGSMTPYLKDPTVTKSESTTYIKGENYDVDAAFKDYEPQISVMPRVAFSFPITQSEEGSGAMFFAHYDVLTQRPQDRNRSNPQDYYYFTDYIQRNELDNPNLRPEKTIEYQLGFKQKIGNFSAITLSAFYRELRNVVQVVSINQAYPRTYRTYGNADFGTVKGFEVGYDMRRTGNVQMRVNYTLQFAEGTGSNDRAQLNLINSGAPNLKQVVPLDIDSRHLITATIDYRYGSGDSYNGPLWFNKQFFANAGANLVLRARSGEPFTRTNNPIGTQLIGDAGRANTIGSIGGSRLPWNVNMDIRIDKDFKLSKKKTNYMNVFLMIQNILNTRNVISVYSYTGNPDDDGYLTGPSNQGSIADQLDEQSFRDLYQVKVNADNEGTFNYSLPRRMRLGLSFNF